MNPTLIWPKPKYLDLGHCLHKNCLPNISTLPPPIMRTWEVTFPIPDWLLGFFHIPHGLVVTIEVHLSTYKSDKKNNSFYIEFYFTRHQETDQPCWVKLVILTLVISWPNPFYQENPERAAHTPSHTSIASDNTFGSVESTGEEPLQLVPPEYRTLSPHPPCFQPEIVLPVPLFTQAMSNTVSIQEILQRIWSGWDLDQVAFKKGRIMFWNLRDINRSDNPQFYSNSSDTVDEDSPTRFHKDRENEGEEEPQEEVDQYHPLQPTHTPTPSINIPDSRNILRELQLVPFSNDTQWEQFLHLEIERIFED